MQTPEKEIEHLLKCNCRNRDIVGVRKVRIIWGVVYRRETAKLSVGNSSDSVEDIPGSRIIHFTKIPGIRTPTEV